MVDNALDRILSARFNPFIPSTRESLNGASSVQFVKIRCPNPECARRLGVPISSTKTSRKCRCPACQAQIAVSVALPQPKSPPVAVADDDEEDGAYGIAQETSLTYLLQREADGNKLTPEEKETKKRLFTERMAANPHQCPACERPLDGSVICEGCRLNLKTRKRLPPPQVTIEPVTLRDPEEEQQGGGGGGGIVVDVIATFLGG